MSITEDHRPRAGIIRRPVRRTGPLSALMLIVAFAASSVLMVGTPDDRPPAPPSTAASTAVWPDAERATLTGELPDGSTFVPGHFLDARTAVGIAADPDGRSRRLIVWHGDESFRLLRKLPLDGGPAYGSFASSGGDLAWVESTIDSPARIWAANLLDPGSPARQLTADIGTAVFSGSQFDLLINNGLVFWTALPAGAGITEIRSVPLTGGPVSMRTEKGLWGLSAWPWLTDGSDRTSVARLRNPGTKHDVEVDSGTGTELLTCSPVWCRVTVLGAGEVSRIDLMHHDGSDRVTVAAGAAGAVGTDVAALDRFELLFALRAGSERDGSTALLVYDIAAVRTVEISPAVDAAFYRAGVLWWSTGDGDGVVWQTLDLRTV